MSVSDPSEPNGRPSGGRKLIAVIHADMVGYSRLIGLDDVGTLERLRSLRSTLIDPAITEHGGRIVNTGGDSLLMVFDSIDGAVRCAVQVQQQVPAHDGDLPLDWAIRFRVGINVGDVIPDGTDVHGGVVNVASRLQAECPPGGICVSRAVREHLRDRLDLAFEELGALNLKNISRPVEAFVLRLDAAASAPKSNERLLVRGNHEVLPLPDRSSLVVLPFVNLSGDPKQEYFADGITEEITTALSRMRFVFVIARGSAFTYKGRPVDVRQVGRELGVRYVLGGSVRKVRDRVRIACELAQAETGHHVWADRFDGVLSDIFDLQDRVAEAVSGALEPTLREAEIERAQQRPTESLNAYDLYLQSLPPYYAGTLEGNERAVRLLREALKLDVDFQLAKAMLANVQMMKYGEGAATQQDREEGVRLATEVIKSERKNPIALCYASLALVVMNKDHATGLGSVEKAIALNPNSAQVLNHAGWVATFACRAEQAIRYFERAIKLSPRDRALSKFLTGSVYAHLVLGRYEAALALALRATYEAPQSSFCERALVAALAMQGCVDDARIAGRRLLGRQRGYYRVDEGGITALFLDGSFASRLTAAFRAAELPE